jgi:hypothetical protein
VKPHRIGVTPRLNLAIDDHWWATQETSARTCHGCKRPLECRHFVLPMEAILWPSQWLCEACANRGLSETNTPYQSRQEILEESEELLPWVRLPETTPTWQAIKQVARTRSARMD